MFRHKDITVYMPFCLVDNTLTYEDYKYVCNKLARSFVFMLLTRWLPLMCGSWKLFTKYHYTFIISWYSRTHTYHIEQLYSMLRDTYVSGLRCYSFSCLIKIHVSRQANRNKKQKWYTFSGCMASIVWQHSAFHRLVTLEWVHRLLHMSSYTNKYCPH